MKSVIAFACLLAVASAGYINSPIVGPAVAYGAYAAYDDGSYKGEGLYESVYKGEGLIESQPLARVAALASPLISAAPVLAARAYAAPINHIGLASEARLVDPIAIAAGAPLPTGDTIEVAAAKAAHLQAHAVAKGLAYGAPVATIAAPGVLAARAYGAPLAYSVAAPALALASEARLVDPIAIAAGAPLPTGDTYEVAAAKAAHLRAHAVAKGHIIAKRSPGLLANTYGGPLAYSVAAPSIALASEPRLIDPVAIAAGAPLPTGDTIEVAAAKAAHLQAHAVAKGLAYGAPVATIAAPGVLAARAYGAPLAYSVAAPAVALASEPRLIDPVAIAAGAPLPTGDTIEVAAAKAAHLQAHAVAKGLAYGVPIGAPGIGLVSEARLVDPVAIAAGAPLPTGDTIEVAAAKAAHYVAHAVAKGHIIAKRSPGLLANTYGGPLAYSVAAPSIALASEARLVDPVAIAAGAPLPTGDTIEVAAAKAAHLQAHAVAKGLAYGAPVATIAAPGVLAARAYGAPLAYSVAAPAVALASEPRLIDPIAIAAGAPLPTGDTIEVAAAKAAHLQAHAVAKGLAYGVPVGAPGIGLVSEARLVDPIAIAAGAPLPTGDTYEVAAAKAAHLRAHAVAKGHIIAKRSPGLLATSYGTPLVRSYGYPTIGAPISLGYGRLYL